MMSSRPADPPASDFAPAARQPTLAGKLIAICGVLISCAFLANLTAGVIPLEIPDILPLVGNLDEVFFSGVLLASLNYLGIPLIPNFRGDSPRRIEDRSRGA